MPISEESGIPEEVAVMRYLIWKPEMAEEYMFDKDGSIKESVRISPGYRGLVDGMLSRTNAAATFPEEDRFKYEKGFSEGMEYRNKIGFSLTALLTDHDSDNI